MLKSRGRDTNGIIEIVYMIIGQNSEQLSSPNKLKEQNVKGEKMQ